MGGIGSNGVGRMVMMMWLSEIHGDWQEVGSSQRPCCYFDGIDALVVMECWVVVSVEVKFGLAVSTAGKK
jgi:hypothetical protein